MKKVTKSILILTLSILLCSVSSNSVKASDVATGKGQITLEAGRKSETVSITKSVNTGDNANILLYAGLGAVAVIGIIVVVIVKRKNKR